MTVAGLFVNDSVGQAPFLRARLAGAAPGMGEVHSYFPVDAFPSCCVDSRFLIRTREKGESEKEACADAVRR